MDEPHRWRRRPVQKSGQLHHVHAQGDQPGHLQVPPVARERDRHRHPHQGQAAAEHHPPRRLDQGSQRRLDDGLPDRADDADTPARAQHPLSACSEGRARLRPDGNKPVKAHPNDRTDEMPITVSYIPNERPVPSPTARRRPPEATSRCLQRGQQRRPLHPGRGPGDPEASHGSRPRGLRVPLEGHPELG